jgi:PAS domain S-box-containing protein
MDDFSRHEEGFLKSDSLKSAMSLLEQVAGSDVMISIHTPQGMYRAVSESFTRILKHDENGLIGNSAYDYFHPDDFQAILKTHAKVSIRPETEEVSYRIRNGNGEYLKVSTLSRTIRGSDQEFILAKTLLDE